MMIKTQTINDIETETHAARTP
ncbi:hypothetical protein CCACVL1_05695 [Corchorus capsularis]|uniref:Uncharacterized protein n=1 Tax=Corchorus capsularis TaxID=210143 RepID=A0A1R3JJD9_COCAP|nr:hypothetical protein CCACVL1_05695 [Corchorus capsularis]